MSLNAQGVNAQSSMVNDFTGTWAAAAEWTGKGDMPQMSLSETTLREIIQVSIGGEELQLQLSNEFSKEPVEIKSIYVADALDSCDIDRKTVKELKFGGQKAVTIAPGETAMSDNFAYKLKPRQRLAVTICYGSVPVNMTSHRGWLSVLPMRPTLMPSFTTTTTRWLARRSARPSADW